MHVKGTSKTPGSGRKKGTRNKSSLPLQELAQKLGIDPFKVLLHFAQGDWEALGYPKETYVVHSAEFSNDRLYIEPATRARAASEACRYLYPVLKAVNITRDPHDIDTDCEDLSNEELDAL